MAKTYPSQKRYQENNPAITFRLKKLEKDKIDKLVDRTGKSISELIRMSLFDPDKGIFEIFHHGVHEGLDIAAEQANIYFFCSVCGEKITILANSKVHQAIIQFLKQQGWGHAGCIDSYQ